MFVSVLATFIQSVFLLIGIFIAMFILNVKLALFCLVIFTNHYLDYSYCIENISSTILSGYAGEIKRN